jgi:hypothetical protein
MIRLPFETVHVLPEAHLVQPFHSLPPHCSHFAASHPLVCVGVALVVVGDEEPPAVTRTTAMSWFPRVKLTLVPVPVLPLYISFQL